MTAVAEVDAPSQLLEAHLLDTTGFRPNDRLFGSVAAFNHFAVTRKLNDELLLLRFAPSQRAWVQIGSLILFQHAVDTSVSTRCR